MPPNTPLTRMPRQRVIPTCVLLLLLALVYSCSPIQPVSSPETFTADEDMLATAAILSLQELAETDALLQVNNNVLAQYIRKALTEQNSASSIFNLTDVQVEFGRQAIGLRARIATTQADGGVRTAGLLGDVQLSFTGGQVEFYPQFRQLVADSTDGETAGEFSYELSRINAETSDALILRRGNRLPITNRSLARLELSATLGDFTAAQVERLFDLNGVFTVAGSALFIDEAYTSAALDLQMVRGIRNCVSTVSVSRAGFAYGMEAREPRQIARLVDAGQNQLFYFTEIADARTPLTVVHYWFANGRPIDIDELTVEPSARWRTWSSHRIDPSSMSHWEVIAVDKASGCVIDSRSIRPMPQQIISFSPDANRPDQPYASYREQFEQAVQHFTMASQRTAIAGMEVRGPAVREALNTLLTDTPFVLRFPAADGDPRHASGSLARLSGQSIACEPESCDINRVCTRDFSACERKRDTRNCMTCQIRNPLNNRCLQESIDPTCEELKISRNRHFEQDWNACIERENSAQAHCEQFVELARQNCEQNAADAVAECTRRKPLLTRQSGENDLARLSTETTISGQVAMIFTNLELTHDLEKIKAGLSVDAGLNLNGKLEVSPAPETGVLASCLAGWSGAFQSSGSGSQLASSKAGNVYSSAANLDLNWSDFFISVNFRPAPMESLFNHDPQLLDACRLGLRPAQIVTSLHGEAGRLMAGSVMLLVQNPRGRIDFSPAMLTSDNEPYRSRAQWVDKNLMFELAP